MREFPYRPGQLTPEWLTGLLRESGRLLNGRVSHLALDGDGAASGFFGEVARLRLRYTGGAGSAPPSVIAKFPTSNAGAFRIGLDRGYYDREVTFYRDFAAGCGLRVPAFYGGAVDLASGASVLLLEDLSGLRLLSAEGKPNGEDARALLRQLGGFHARWWDDRGIDRLDWLPPTDSGAERFQRDFPIAWPLIVKHLTSPPGLATPDMGERIAEQIPAVKRELARPPRVFLHADLRKENIFFDDTQGVAVVLDWQHCRRGRAALDLASHLFGEARGMGPAEEAEMLKVYHDALTQAGAGDYPLVDCVHDYRLAMVDRFVNVGSGLATVDPDTANGQMAIRYMGECGLEAFVSNAKAAGLL